MAPTAPLWVKVAFITGFTGALLFIAYLIFMCIYTGPPLPSWFDIGAPIVTLGIMSLGFYGTGFYLQQRDERERQKRIEQEGLLRA